MPMTIYKLYAAVATDDAASLDIQMDGTIKSMLMTARWQGVDAINEGGMAEMSFLSTNTFSANDARGSLMLIQSISGLLTSGMLQTAVNQSLSSLEIPVAAGERIHLHIVNNGTITTVEVHGYLFVEDKGIQRVPGRRR